MSKTLFAILVAFVTTLVNRAFASRAAARLTSYLEERSDIQCALAFNRGYGEGHQQGVKIGKIRTIQHNDIYLKD